jgi:hypothetical protein
MERDGCQQAERKRHHGMTTQRRYRSGRRPLSHFITTPDKTERRFLLNGCRGTLPTTRQIFTVFTKILDTKIIVEEYFSHH